MSSPITVPSRRHAAYTVDFPDEPGHHYQWVQRLTTKPFSMLVKRVMYTCRACNKLHIPLQDPKHHLVVQVQGWDAEVRSEALTTKGHCQGPQHDLRLAGKCHHPRRPASSNATVHRLLESTTAALGSC